jgi:hypothetical protein
LRTFTILAVLSALTALAGCGGEGSSGKPSGVQTGPFSAADQAAIREAQTEIRSYCRQLSLYLARRRGPPSQAENGRAYGAVDRLATIARLKPAAEAAIGRTARELLGDLAEDLEGSNCAPNVVQRIDQALAGLPAQ